MQHPNPIILPPSLIASLYENVLIDEAVAVVEQVAKEATSTKKIVIIAEAKTNVLPPNQQLFLEAILKACKINIADVAVLTDKDPLTADHKEINAHYGAENIILFGRSPSSIALPVYFPPFQVQSFQETNYLHAPSLEAIEADKTLKVQLWQSLKQLFP